MVPEENCTNARSSGETSAPADAATSPTPSSQRRSITARASIAAIAGEDYDRDAPISDLIKQQLGINFRTPLLEFNLDYFASFMPAERLPLQKRIEEAADKLTYFREANIEAFNTSPAVWMPVAELP